MNAFPHNFHEKYRNMNNKLSILALGLMASLGMLAAPLTPQQALQRASADGPQRLASKNYKTEPVYTVRTQADTPAAYVFAADGSKGYKILAADDVAFPVLAYSEDGEFDINNIPEQLRWWLGEYARQIEWAALRTSEVAAAPVANSGWHAIEPLVKSKWDQDVPYNNDCPTPKNSDQHCYTGCVATSMAQVMNYHKYPDKGQGSISYRAPKINKTLMMSFGSKEFDWDNMLDNYVAGEYTDAQAAAVAYLMKACGYSVKMNYGTDASGAAGSSIGSSLKEYFKYDEGCRSEQRILYSMSQWSQMIYDNLENVGPVIINGRDFDGSDGHSFICDGYDGNGYFHFNWGWSGMSDGYFSLDALNPDAMGIGGFGGGFNYGQNAIFGIQPPTGETYVPVNNIMIYGNMTASVSGNKLTIGSKDYSPLGWGNPSDYTVSGKIGLKYELQSDPSVSVVGEAKLRNSQSVTLSPDNYFPYPSNTITATVPSSLSDGTYKMTLVFAGSDDVWKPTLTPWGYSNFVYLTKTGNSYSVTDPARNQIQVVSAEIASDLYYRKNTLFKVTYKNDSDYELSQGVVPRLYKNNTLCMEGSGVLVTVGPHETVEKEFVSRFNTVGSHSFTSQTDYEFALYNPQDNVLYGKYGNVTMKKAPATTSVICTEFSVQNAEKVDYEFGSTTRNPYLVQNPGDFTIDFSYLCRMGYFDGRVKLSICEVDPANALNYIPVVDEIYSVMPFLSAGQSGGHEVKVSFPEAQMDKLYAVRASYSESSSWKVMDTLYFITGDSGVDGISDDSQSAESLYYNLQGMPVANPEKGQVVIRRTGAKTEKIIF